MNDLFDFCPRTRDFAVMGNPIVHSLSPAIHELFGQQLGIDLCYDCIQVDWGGFDQAVSHFQAHGGAGLNVTVPFKVEAWKLCCRSGNRVSERAAVAESVNTLTFQEGSAVEGENTDGIGILRDLERNLSFPVHHKRILVLGAGGAVRGVLGPLLEGGPAAVHIANRTASKAMALVDRFQHPGDDRITGGALENAREPYDLVINGTAASLDGGLLDINPVCIHRETLAYDMMYGARPTRFLQWALNQGAARASDGLGMLVEQAAESFRIWHGAFPETVPVIRQLRKRWA